jgi:integrase
VGDAVAKADMKFRRAESASKPYKISDEGGLFLLVHSNGSKYWRMRIFVDGRERLLSFGVYPAVSLELARAKRNNVNERVARGESPLEEKTVQPLPPAQAITTFEGVARAWHDRFVGQWSKKHGEKLLRRLEMHVFPHIGGTPISSVTASDVRAIVERVALAGTLDTAHGTRIVTGQVFRYAIAMGHTLSDPTSALRGIIPGHTRVHVGALTDPKAVGLLMQRIRASTCAPVIRYVMLISALTFQRPGNVRLMEWSELDIEQSMWTIPSVKVKRSKHEKTNGQPHLVPLSKQAVAIFRLLKASPYAVSPLCFPGPRISLRPLSDNTVNAALRSLGYSRAQMTAHGFRAMARTLLDEQLEMPLHLIEAQLAHKVADPLGRAYNRTSHIQQRVAMMQKWADYLDELAASTPLVLGTTLRKNQ